jgi:hypothetical protein
LTKIKTIEHLRQLYKLPKGRAVEKVITKLEEHSINFIARSPFLILGTSRKDGLGDVTPRGGEPGFVKVKNEKTLVIPDFAGNNRLDSLTNIIERPSVGLLFLIPGVDESLRLNGVAEICDDLEMRELFRSNKKMPTTVLLIKINEIYLHCAKALMRSKLWEESTKIDRLKLPTIGKMISDQINDVAPIETQEEMIERYKKSL